MNAGPPPLRVLRAGEVPRQDDGPRWLIEALWPHSAVGIVGGQPKSWKSWLGLDVALSVASATPCLGRYAVMRPGLAMVYLAEDALPEVRGRLDCLCKSRSLDLDTLELLVVAEPVLRLDQELDRLRLREAVARYQPRLLVLDPLVRLHRRDENCSQEISELLGYLRELQRTHDVSVLLAHHTSKRGHARHGQSLRGSSDLHAWTDVGLYLTWHGDQLHLTPELRSARAVKPFQVRLVEDDPTATHLAIVGPDPGRDAAGGPAPTLAQRIVLHLQSQAHRAVRRADLRDALKVNNNRLGDALQELERLGLIVRAQDGWRAARPGDGGVPYRPSPGGARNDTRNGDLPGDTDPGSGGAQPGKG